MLKVAAFFTVIALIGAGASLAQTESPTCAAHGKAKAMTRMIAALIAISLACGFANPTRASECDEVIGRHMAGQAMLAAQFVASAEKVGMTAQQINAVLTDIAANSAIEEFWITDGAGHAYLTNTGVDFTFSRDAAKQPQASAFWALIDGSKKIVIQEARRREIDDKVFKYVGVAGVDKPRIVQVGVSEKHLPVCK